MPRIAMVIGILSIVLGVGGYLVTDGASATALIPAAFGIVLTYLGSRARRPEKREMAMHIAAAWAMIGYLACLPGLSKLPAVLNHQAVPRPAAAISQSIMAFLMAAFVMLAVRSFHSARKNEMN